MLATSGCLGEDILKYELTGEFDTSKAEIKEKRVSLEVRDLYRVGKLTDSRPCKSKIGDF